MRMILDLTYRCNNNCTHCWVRNQDRAADELTLPEIQGLVRDASRLGVTQWHLSGGEPLVRDDFPQILDLISGRGEVWILNTNGTLITKKLAQVMKRPYGTILLSMYGADAEVHDAITKTPGSFDALMTGIRNLTVAGAPFTIQVVPLVGNYHQMAAMEEVAHGLTPNVKYGASWLYLSAEQDFLKNAEIEAQRLEPGQVIDYTAGTEQYRKAPLHNYLFRDCIDIMSSFHVDPYGQFSWCAHVKDPALRYDLRKGNLSEAMTTHLQMCRNIEGGEEYNAGCRVCNIRDQCKWCPAYAWLEHGNYEAKVPYLCKLAREYYDWMDTHDKQDSRVICNWQPFN